MKVVLGVPHKVVITEVYTKNTAAKKFANHLYTCTVGGVVEYKPRCGQYRIQ